MNNTFDFNRFYLLVRRQWINFGKIYLISLAVVVGIIITFYAFAVSDALEHMGNWTQTLNFRIPLFLFLGLLFLTMMASNYFSDMGQKPKAIIELLIPASKLEKFLVSIVYTVLLAFASYILVFYIIDLSFVSYLRGISTSTTTYTNADGTVVVIDNLAYLFKRELPEQFGYFVFLPFLFNSLFLLGSLAFRNFHYIKTAISLMVFIGCWIGIVVFVMERVTRDTIWVGGGFWQEEANVLKAVCAVGVVLTLFFWCVSYLRLKEQEV